MALGMREVEEKNLEVVEEGHQRIQEDPHQPLNSRERYHQRQREVSNRTKHHHVVEVHGIPTTGVEDQITEVGEVKAEEMLPNNLQI